MSAPLHRIRLAVMLHTVQTMGGAIIEQPIKEIDVDVEGHLFDRSDIERLDRLILGLQIEHLVTGRNGLSIPWAWKGALRLTDDEQKDFAALVDKIALRVRGIDHA